MTQINDTVYVNTNRDFLVVKTYQGIIPPSDITVGIPEKGRTVLLNIGNPYDIFFRILIRCPYKQSEIAELFGISQQHVSRMYAGNRSFKWNIEKIKILIDLFFKHYIL